MLEFLRAQVLGGDNNSFLSRVLNLDVLRLHWKIWDGEAVFENVECKPVKLGNFELELGRIGRVQLNVPNYRTIFSDFQLLHLHVSHLVIKVNHTDDILGECNDIDKEEVIHKLLENSQTSFKTQLIQYFSKCVVLQCDNVRISIRKNGASVRLRGKTIHLENNLTTFEGVSCKLDNEKIMDPVNFQFDLGNFDAQIPGIAINVRKDQVARLMKFLPAKNDPRPTKSKIFQKIIRNNHFARIRKNKNWRNVYSYCKDYIAYKKLYSAAQSLADANTVYPIGEYSNVPESANNDDKIAECANFWDIKRQLVDYERRLSAEIIADYRYFIKHRIHRIQSGSKFNVDTKFEFRLEDQLGFSIVSTDLILNTDSGISLRNTEVRLRERLVCKIKHIRMHDQMMIQNFSVVYDDEEICDNVCVKVCPKSNSIMSVNHVTTLDLNLDFVEYLQDFLKSMNDLVPKSNKNNTDETKIYNIAFPSLRINLADKDQHLVDVAMSGLETTVVKSGDVLQVSTRLTEIQVHHETSELISARNRIDIQLRFSSIERMVHCDFHEFSLLWSPEQIAILQHYLQKRYSNAEHRENAIENGENSQKTPFSIRISVAEYASIKFQKYFRNFVKLNFRQSSTFLFKTKVAGGALLGIDLNGAELLDESLDHGCSFYKKIFTTNEIGINYESFSNTIPLQELHYTNFSEEIVDAKLTIIARVCKLNYLNQYIMELMDYFFEGICGDFIFGKFDSLESDNKVASPPDRIKFTHFSMTFQSAQFIVPVSYTSPQHLSISSSCIRIANFFTSEEIMMTSSLIPATMFFNNANVTLENVNFQGAKLHHRHLDLSLKWFLGGDAYYYAKLLHHTFDTNLVIEELYITLHAQLAPKWNVRLNISHDATLTLKLVSLVKHVIDYNVGENTRGGQIHTPDSSTDPRLVNHNPYNIFERVGGKSILSERRTIYAGYRYNNPGIPTTYKVTINVNSLALLMDRHMSITLSNMEYQIQKLEDIVTCQKLSANLIYAGNAIMDNVIFSAQLNFNSQSHNLIVEYYKQLEVTDCIIHRKAAAPSLKLDDVIILTPDQLDHWIEVDDKWYNTHVSHTPHCMTLTGTKNKVYQFCCKVHSCNIWSGILTYTYNGVSFGHSISGSVDMGIAKLVDLVGGELAKCKRAFDDVQVKSLSCNFQNNLWSVGVEKVNCRLCGCLDLMLEGGNVVVRRADGITPGDSDDVAVSIKRLCSTASLGHEQKLTKLVLSNVHVKRSTGESQVQIDDAHVMMDDLMLVDINGFHLKHSVRSLNIVTKRVLVQYLHALKRMYMHVKANIIHSVMTQLAPMLNKSKTSDNYDEEGGDVENNAAMRIEVIDLLIYPAPTMPFKCGKLLYTKSNGEQKLDSPYFTLHYKPLEQRIRCTVLPIRYKVNHGDFCAFCKFLIEQREVYGSLRGGNVEKSDVTKESNGLAKLDVQLDVQKINVFLAGDDAPTTHEIHVSGIIIKLSKSDNMLSFSTQIPILEVIGDQKLLTSADDNKYDDAMIDLNMNYRQYPSIKLVLNNWSAFGDFQGWLRCCRFFNGGMELLKGRSNKSPTLNSNDGESSLSSSTPYELNILWTNPTLHAPIPNSPHTLTLTLICSLHVLKTVSNNSVNTIEACLNVSNLVCYTHTCDSTKSENKSQIVLQPVRLVCDVIHGSVCSTCMIKVEPVLCLQLGYYRDLQLCLGVLEDMKEWYRGVNSDSSDHNHSKKDNVTLEKISVEGDSVFVTTTLSKTSRKKYEVTFTDTKLGLQLQRSQHGIAVQTSPSDMPMIHIGDLLLHIQDTDVCLLDAQWTLQKVTRALRDAPRPTTLTFCRTSDVAEDGRKSLTESTVEHQEESKCTNVTFKTGVPNGIELQQCPISSLGIVSGVQTCLYDAAIITSGEVVPAGAVLTCVNGEQDMQFAELLELCATGLLAGDSGSGEMEITTSYSIAFLPPQNWPRSMHHQIHCAGFQFILLDDMHANSDVPLMKINVLDVKLDYWRSAHLALNSGVSSYRNPNAVDSSESSFESPSSKKDSTSCVESALQVDRTKITKASPQAQKANLTFEHHWDYYNSRVAIWEPLIEPNGLCLTVKHFRNLTSVNLCDFSHGIDGTGGNVRINCSDAAIEVLVRAVKQWSDICNGVARKSIDPHDDNNYLQKEADAATVADQTPSNVSTLLAKIAENPNRDHNVSFIIRNKTGIKFAFVQQTSKRRMKKSSGKKKALMMLPEDIAVNEDQKISYIGLEDYPSKVITELDPDAEHSFALNLEQDNFKLAVSLSGACELLKHFEVTKIGKCVRYIRMQCDNGKTKVIPLFYKVEWLHNKRVITLSSTVFIDTIGRTKLECGVRILDEEQSATSCDVVPIGTTPAILPMHLLLRNIPLMLVVRPIDGLYSWSSDCILSYDKDSEFVSRNMNNEDDITLEYKFAAACTKVCCRSTSLMAPPTWVYAKVDMDVNDKAFYVKIGSCLSLRNLLPMAIDWEASDCFPTASSAVTILDGSTTTRRDKDDNDSPLKSGQCAEIYTANLGNIMPHLRLMINGVWSEWVELSLDYCSSKNNLHNDNDAKGETQLGLRPALITTDIALENSTQITVGIKIIPKTSFASNLASTCSSSKQQKQSDYAAYNDMSLIGMEVILFTELWIKNLTDLPLAVGSPNNSKLYQNLNNLAAEAALLELTSVLEGRRLSDYADTGHITMLAIQTADFVQEEVFEYIEIDISNNNKLLRRWYAAEQHDIELPEPAEFELNDDWRWVTPWSMDMRGTKLADGGWESAKYLDQFGPKRIFNHREKFRRRRWHRGRSKKVLTLPDSHKISDVVVYQTPKGTAGGPQISVKILDGAWSPCGAENSVIRVHGGRWPSLTSSGPHCMKDSVNSGNACDLSYVISPLSGVWGEYTNVLSIMPRIMVRNDSKQYCMEVKQLGANNKSTTMIKPGEIVPLWWSNLSNPELICVRPVSNNKFSSDDVYMGNNNGCAYRWSGGFDPCSLGMIALRIRTDANFDPISSKFEPKIRTIRATVSIRPKSNNTGLNVSLKEEQWDGTGALFRIENFSPFPLWVAQEGLMANPISLHTNYSSSDASISTADLVSQISAEMAGDRIDSNKTLSFGLDDPQRQVKHGGGSEFLRVALAPLRSKDGLETTKLIKLKIRNEFARLSPSKLTANLEEELREEFLGIRVVGTVVADGPTRVVRFCLMQKEISTSNKLGNAVRRQAKRSESYLSEITDGAMKEAGFSATRSSSSLSTFSSQQARDEEARILILTAAFEAIELKNKCAIPSQISAQKHALAGTGAFRKNGKVLGDKFVEDDDQDLSLRASFSGFVFSLVDQEPSEIAVVSLQSVKMLTKWNKQRSKDATVAVSVGWLQIDNHCPNAPFPVALCPDSTIEIENVDGESENVVNLPEQPVIAVGINFAPKHISEVTCLRSVTVAPRNIAVGVDLAFIVRLQRFLLGAQDRFEQAWEDENDESGELIWKYAESRELWPFPNLQKMFSACVKASGAGKESRELFFEGLTVFPYNLSLSVASPRAMTNAQAMIEGPGAAAIHTAVRKGDLLVTAGSGAGVLGVKIGRTNRTALAVVRGIFKSIIVDALLRCEEASLAFPGIGIRNYLTNGPQVTTYLLAHYLAALRSNVPSLLGSLAAFGNPLGLIRGLGDGVSDFVSEPIKGLKKSLEELDPTFVIDGVARGTGSLARHTIGGVADSASLLTQTLSKNMAVLTLDRRYAQKRDRSLHQNNPSGATPTIVDGIGTGSAKLFKGVYDGVSGVIRAPMRGAEKSGAEGFAKGVGKGLLGLVVKPVVGLSDAATDIMIGVKGSVEGGTYNDIGKMQQRIKRASQLRPRRVFYGRERTMREYQHSDATAAQLMMATRLGGEQYYSHVDMGNAGVALLSVRRVLILGNNPGDGGGNERACIKYKNITKIDVRQIPTPDESIQWGVIVLLKTARQDGSAVEVISCDDSDVAHEIYALLNKARSLVSSISMR